jgi:uncharacterized secreted protein with C-terminal beta-propeller domain
MNPPLSQLLQEVIARSRVCSRMAPLIAPMGFLLCLAQPAAVASSTLILPSSTPAKAPALLAVNLPFKATQDSLEIPIPTGCVSCRVELRLKGKTSFLRWRSYTFQGKPTSLTMPLPKSLQVEEWRASGTVNLERKASVTQAQKFPEAFYQGKRTFQKSAALGYQTFSANAPSRLKALDSALSADTSKVASNSPASSATPSTNNASQTATQQIAEADIWKAEGSTVYFFNQLRGLQVINLADPAQPRLAASLRLPASGQDLYILPETAPGERLVALLTQKYVSSAQIELILVRVNAEGASEISRTSVTGSLCDSRLLGNRLYLVSTDWGYWGSAGLSRDPLSTPLQAPSNLHELIIQPNGSVQKGTSFPINASSDGSSPVAENALISAGNDWLAVSTSNWSDNYRSRISLFRLEGSGISAITPKPVLTSGRIQDKFKVSFQNNVLSAVSIDYSAGWSEPVTQLENFSSSGEPLAQLEIIRREHLFATRFTQGKMYAVTADRHDPLWVIDLSDPAKPEIKGHVEVPGFSTYLEPMGENGEFLFTLGLVEGQVAASLFNVADPSKPALIERAAIDQKTWGFSEAVYNEKALKVLPEDGLALIPFSSPNFGPVLALAAGKTNSPAAAAAPAEPTNSFVQLLDINLKNGGSLKMRGRLYHQFEPRRATMLNGVLTSISQKELITAKIDNRDQPTVLADVSLAWPIDLALLSGDYLLQISDGSSAVWSGEKARLRISKADSEDTVVNEIPLGDGSVQEAVLRGSKLYVLRKNWGASLGLVRFLRSVKESTPQLALDIYDASNLPNLPQIGSTAVVMDRSDTNCTVSKLHWVNDSLAVVLTQAQPLYFWGGWNTHLPRPGDTSKVALALSLPFGRPVLSTSAAILRPFDVSNPVRPTALASYTLSATANASVSATGAGENLFVFGYAENPTETPATGRFFNFSASYPSVTTSINRIGIVDFANPRRPALLKPATLPGRLISVEQVSREGFLAFTESIEDQPNTLTGVFPVTTPNAILQATGTLTSNGSSTSKLAPEVLPSPADIAPPTADPLPAPPKRLLQASLIVDAEASLISSLEITPEATLAVQGRTVFVGTAGSLQRWSLDDTATFAPAGKATLPWTPAVLSVQGTAILGASNDRLLRVSWPGLDPLVESWEAGWGYSLERVCPGPQRSLYLPMGDYGVRRLKAQ